MGLLNDGAAGQGARRRFLGDESGHVIRGQSDSHC